ncbi:flagellar hook-length control protein FliK [Defluviitalea saccharophila]|uniref:Flagellar hook-length control protein FliK n=1 Tax=Defluviitalea saccharophila TaxID=879970 RepID=A0ABZ2Y6I8_9FIRM
MNIQLPALEFAVGKIQNNQEVKRKEFFNENHDSFDSVLKNTQKNKENYEAIQSKTSTSRNEKSTKSAHQEIKNEHVEDSQLQSVNEEQEIPTEDEIIEAWEEKTGMTKEQIQSVLEALGITVYDLFLTQNLQQFIQRIHSVEDPMELLSIPNVNQTYKDILSLFEELKESYPILQDIAENSELLKSTIVDSEEIMDLASPEENQLQEHEPQNMESVGNSAVLEKNSQLEDDFSHKDSEKQFQSENAPMIEIEKEKTPSADLLTDDELQEINNDIGVSSSEFTEYIEVSDNQVIIQHNTISEGKFIESTQHQLNSRPVDTEQLIKQMVDHIKVNIKEDSTEMNLQLKPDHLGNLSLKIVTERGIITAQFVAESQAVKEIIEANFNQLKDVLQEQGLLIENLEVSVKQDFQEQQSNFMERNSSKSSKRIREILSNLTEDSSENYNVEYNNPYIRSESEIDFSA